MNLQPIIKEMRLYWLEGITGGQQLIGDHHAHYNIAETPGVIIQEVKNATRRKSFIGIRLWEIEAEEQCNIVIRERLDHA